MKKLIPAFVLIGISSLLFSQGIERKQILVMHSYHQGLLWTDNITRAIQETFAEDEGEYNIYFEYLDTKRNAGEEYFLRLSEFEKQKKQLAELDFDIIIASDNNALRFLVEHGEKLFGPVPVVFCGVNNFTIEMLGNKNYITGVPEYIDYYSTLDLIDKLHPEKKNIMIIIDRTQTGNAITSELKKIEGEYRDRFQFHYLRDFSIEDIDETISALGDDYLIYLLVMNSDQNGTFISYSDAIKMVRHSATVPIYGSWDFFFGNGIVGGMLISGYGQGKKAAEMALEILKGKNPWEIPIVSSGANSYMFDYNEMEIYGIEEKMLPPNSFIHNKPDSFFIRNRTILILISAFIILWGVTIIAINKYQKAKRQRLREMNETLDRKVQEALSEVKTLSGLLPICAHCNKIRDDSGYWNKIETYIKKHSEVDFTHGLCPDCAEELYPQHFKKKK